MLNKIRMFLYHIYINLKWHPFNPWCVGRMNLAYKNYIESDLYKYRVEELGHEFAFKHYHELQEVKIFISFFTPKNKLKLLFTPFSCGNQYNMPPIWKAG